MSIPIARAYPRILQITDTHLGQGDTQGAANWAIMAALIRRLSPDLVVHTGDLMLSDPGSVSDRATGHAALAALGLPFRVTPGNHDVGDTPSPNAIFGQVVNHDWIAAWSGTFGSDRWALELGVWTLAGLNAQLFGTGWVEEEAQWDWLARLLAEVAPRPVALFMHKPPYLVQFGEERDQDPMTIPAVARARLRHLATGSTLRLIACGHRHEHRVYLGSAEEPAVLWAPPVSFVGQYSAPVPDVGGHPGCVLHTLLGDRILSQVLSPPGLSRFDSSFLHRMLEAQRAGAQHAAA
ncbi:metallophosphoesterase [Roseomonas hellenica]|uniref:Metallophosphoesterase n=1 Tax=Plastoroseomonas hellenica TaxID=2687306 RepID=A0ABS5EXV2_9PROT|nr:metallophosphoesterase [Plastoroseomonas hellenica]MBR0665135.1 metallophosphoesterase [Plastoroseomonas hellenica]